MEPGKLLTSHVKPDTPPGSLVRAKNAIRKYKKGLTNEPGTSLIDGMLGQIIGVIATAKEDIVFVRSIENISSVLTPVSHIYRVTDTAITIVFRSTTMNFSPVNPIQGDFEYNFKDELIIVWWEGISDTANKIRTVNLSCLPFDLDGNKYLVDESQIELLNLTPANCPPQISLATIRNSGGVLKSGNYQLYLQYINEDGTEANAFFTGDSLNIYEALITSNLSTETNPYGPGDDYDIINFQGSDGDITTGKSIKLNITNIDTDYAKLRIGFVLTANGVTTGNIAGEIDIVSANAEYVITGGNLATISLEALLGLNAYYTKAEGGAILNNRLYLINVIEESYDLEGFQEIVNDATVAWDYTTPIGIESDEPLESYKDPNVVATIKGLFPDEVYALYIGFYLKSGKWLIFHKPGRVAGTTDYTNTSGESDIDFLARPSTNLIGVSETALVQDLVTANPGIHLSQLEFAALLGDNVKLFQVFDTSKNDGTMGYWENENETYPTCFPDFSGQKVRHHKTPSIEQIKRRFGSDIFFDGAGAGTGIDGINSRVLTINISNVVIPNELADEICYWGVFYAKRTFENSSHIATGYISNKIYKTEEENQLPLPHSATEHVDSFRFNNFSLLNILPQVSASYVKTHFSFNIPESGGVEPDYSFINGALYYYNMLKDGSAYVDYEALRNITSHSYYPANVIITGDDGDGNLLGEETFKVGIEHTMSFVPRGILFGTLFSYKPDLYVDYDNQELAFGGRTYTPDLTTAQLKNGDCFVVPYSFKLHTVIPTPSGSINPYLGLLYTFPAYDSANIWWRQEGEGEAEKFYPKTMLHQYTVTDEEEYLQKGNYYEYNSDFSQLLTFPFYQRDIKRGCLEDSACETKEITKFPYRIIRSLPSTTETSEIRFRTFRANDYSELDRNIGKGVSLSVFRNTLFVLMEYGCFYFKPKDILETEDAAVALLGSDLFDQLPDKIVDVKGGYAGCKSKFSVIVTPYGVFFVDTVLGRAYLFDGGLTEITADIRYDFELEFKYTSAYLDNPIIGKGVIAGFDQEFNRILMSVTKSDNKDPNTGTTYSFDLNRKEFVSQHDYIPTLFSFSVRGLKSYYSNFGLSNVTAWKHNKNLVNYGRFYNTQYSCYIDIVLADIESALLIKSVNWITQAISNLVDISDTVTFDKIMCYNQNQCTGLVVLVKQTGRNYYSKNLSKRKNGFIFGKLFDLVKNPLQAFLLPSGLVDTTNIDLSKSYTKIQPFNGNYFVSRLEFSNTVTSTELTVLDVGVDLVTSKVSTPESKI
jgi:hypothetical protein